MKIVHSLLSVVALLLLGTVLLTSVGAAEPGSEAKIVKIVGTGAPTVVVGGETKPGAEGMPLPVNAEVQTTTQEVYIEVAVGVVATVKPNSHVAVGALNASESVLDLRQGRLVTQIDKNRPNARPYRVRTAQGVAAARGTSFTISSGAGGLSITTTADGVEFTAASGARVVVQAGMVSFTPAGATEPLPAVPLATAAASNPEVVSIIRDAVVTAATVVQNNLGSISAESATNIMSQVVAVAVGAVPSEATTFTSQAVTAVTAAGSATGGNPGVAAAAVTAAAITAAPTQAAQIAGAAAQAAPTQAGAITAAAQQVAPESKDAIAQSVATNTGQSTTTVQSNADASTSQGTSGVNAAKDATSTVIPPPVTPPSVPPAAPETTATDTTPTTTVDPTITNSPAI
jgi:hypothetical protein